ncbi:MAG: MoaD/ThiS family protein [Candidatus Bathyarchaeia archaeon]
MKRQDEHSARPSVLESRRSFLRRAAALAIGATILLVGADLTETSVRQNAHYPGSSIPTKDPAETRASLITVRVYYSMMAQYTDLSEEYFVLQSPAVLQDLMNTVVIRHPSMAEMMQLMLMLLNGIPAKPIAPLKDGDVIQFIPMSAGG